MKNLKKLGSIALALVMVMAMMIPAFAANGKTITVKNANDGITYNLYKIFDASVVADRPSNTADGITYSLPAGVTEMPTELAGVFTVNTTDDTISASTNDGAMIMAAVKAWAEGKTPADSKSATGGEVTFTSLADGYYAILAVDGDTAGNMVTITSIAPNATVYDKNDPEVPHFPTTDAKVAYEVDANGNITDKKKDTFDLGDTVGYKITFEAKNWAGAGENAKRIVKYNFTDTMDPADYLSTTNNVKVTVNGTDVTNGDHAVTVTGRTNGMLGIEIPWGTADSSYYADGATIVISYTGVVNRTGKGINTVAATYTTDTTTKVTEKPHEDVFNSTILVDKFTTVDGVKTPLADAKFVLKNEAGQFYSISGNDVTWIDAPADGSIPAGAEVTTAIVNGVGTASFTGLKNGTYQLIETEAPAGYNLKTTPTEVVVDANSTTNEVSYTSPIENNSGAVLPSTGGMGTTIFYAIGGILLAGSAILFVTKKRMGE